MSRAEFEKSCSTCYQYIKLSSVAIFSSIGFFFFLLKTGEEFHISKPVKPICILSHEMTSLFKIMQFIIYPFNRFLLSGHSVLVMVGSAFPCLL